MKTGTWFAMVSSKRAIEIPALAKQLKFIEGESAKVDGNDLVVTVDDDLSGKGSFTIHLSKAKSVLTEARELAERKGEGRADRAEIAKLDARYELSWARKDSDAVYDTLLTVASKLKKLTGAVIYNQVDAEFMDIR
jgi:hypothetical protein